MKSLVAGVAFLAATVSTMAAPTVGWNYNYIVKAIRWDAKENVIWAETCPQGTACGASDLTYLHYVYATGTYTPESGNGLEEAKALFSALGLARSLNKLIGFQVLKQAGARWVFSSVHVQE